MTISFKLFFPENRHFTQKTLHSLQGQSSVSYCLMFFFLIYLSLLSLLDYLVPDPTCLAQDSRHFQSHDALQINGQELICFKKGVH